MKKFLLVFGATLVVFCGCVKSAGELTLWYDKPAKEWVEALPLGNGRLGAMVYGNPVNEEIQLNEETVWGGGAHNNVNNRAKDGLDEIRALIFDKKNAEAQKLCNEYIASKGGQGMPYQTVGSLYLNFQGVDQYSDYYRDLDLENAIATTTFSADGVIYTREMFTSFTDQVVVIRLTASGKGKLSFKTGYDTPYKVNEKGETILGELGGKKYATYSQTNNCDSHEGVEGKVKFTTIYRVLVDGGELNIEDDGINVQNANSAMLLVSIGTNFVNYKDVSGNSQSVAEEYMEAAFPKIVKSYNKARKSHVDYYSNMFGRVSLDLGTNDQAKLTTDKRVEMFASEFDPQLASLYFQYGRYLLISSSQPGGQAANLQGIWNDQLFAPWDGKYTTDINVEMNYWPTEICNMSEMGEPFLNLVKECAEHGAETASMYGCRGWALHHNTDIWRSTGAVDGAAFGIWPTSNAWFCQQLWDSYLFRPSKEYLGEIYPLMKGACEFFIDFLVPEPTNGWLVVAPSYSPENTPRVTDRPGGFVIIAGATMDNQLMAELFNSTIEAAGMMEENTLFIDTLRNIANRLAPMKVGSWGQLQEWMEDWDNPRDNHRHVSHLWGLYPGSLISVETPELFKAARVSLEARGDQSTGWSMGWKVCLWARLLDGNHAYKLIQDQLSPSGRGKGGTYPNLFDAHPPFQIDGNFGCTAGIAEMLIQSHTGSINLLPALPDAWAAGSLKGLRCRGGFEIEELTWENGVPVKVVIRSTIGGALKVKWNGGEYEKKTVAGKSYRIV